MTIKYWLNAAFATYYIAAVASLARSKHECGMDEFPCSDFTCIGLAQKCDGQFDCPDGGDEALSLCKDSGRPVWPILFHCSAAPHAQTPAVCPAVCARRPGLCSYALLAEHGAPGTCKLPPYPEHGSYSVSERLTSDSFTLHFSCDGQYDLHGSNHVRCQDGKWLGDHPICKINTGTYAIKDGDVRK